MKRILSFEADQELAAQLKAAFWRYGCDLDVVADSKTGIDKALKEKPDLILLTIELPRENGFSICNMLKRNKTLKSIPLILLSTECTDETFLQHKKMQTAAEGYVHKPFEFETLLNEVKSLIDLQPTGSGQAGLDPAPITDIYQSLDGAFDVIQEGDTIHQPQDLVPPPLLTPLPSSDSKGGSHRSSSPGPKSILQQNMIVLWSPDSKLRGQCFSFADEDSKSITFGREIDNVIAVEDPTMSANHLLVESKDSKVSVRDLGSGSGTFINDELVSHQELKGGEVVRFGETSLLYLRGLDVESQLERIIRELSECDPHTRVYSYRKGREKLEQRMEMARQDMTPLSIAAVAVDDLNRIAYRYGDMVAQKVLEEMASTLRATTPQGVVSRDFGSGFIVVMPDSPEKMALGMAEGWRFESGVSEILAGNHSVTATLSIGVLEWREDWNMTDFIRRAYKLLYEAQAGGGNRVVSRKHADRSANQS